TISDSESDVMGHRCGWSVHQGYCDREASSCANSRKSFPDAVVGAVLGIAWRSGGQWTAREVPRDNLEFREATWMLRISAQRNTVTAGVAAGFGW
ncbi:MAG: hypothetical protein AAFU85_27465, partial [Planctomycetota bacterium]